MKEFTLPDILDALPLARGPRWHNRFALAPMTNSQSHADGTLSDEEARWLEMRAEGGFGLVMTAAAHVEAGGQGFPGQLGVFDDRHVQALSRLAQRIRTTGAVSSVQLHHAGIRSPADLVGQPVGPSPDEETGSRQLETAEVERVRDSFIEAARRTAEAGFDGAEIHGAHGYLLAQFLSPELNQRQDRYGGDAENRSRLLIEIIDGIRATCPSDFQLGLRLSPERFGQDLGEIRDLAVRVMEGGKLDYLDMSLWDIAKKPEDPNVPGSLLEQFTSLPRGNTALGVAGKIGDRATAQGAIDAGCDFVMIGRAAILHHDFPRRIAADRSFMPVSLPVSRTHLEAEGVSPTFQDYLSRWPNFVAE